MCSDLINGAMHHFQNVSLLLIIYFCFLSVIDKNLGGNAVSTSNTK